MARAPWRDVDWREHQRWARIGERAVNYVDLGSGPAVVFVHGLGGNWANWLENVAEIAASGRRVVAVDLPGFGASEMPADGITIRGYAECVERLCSRLDLGAVTLVGHSLGGFVGADLAIRHPQRVERLVLVAAAGLSAQERRNERLLAVLYRTEAILTWLGANVARRAEGGARRRRLRRLLLRGAILRADLLDPAIVSEQLAQSGRPGFLPALDAATRYPIRDRLAQIACPTLIVWGADDPLVPVRDADDFEALIPDARKEVWPDTGHLPMLERPERFNAVLSAFLR